jgi:hypothetical protein
LPLPRDAPAPRRQNLHQMPSLLRFLTVIGIIFGVCYGAIWAVATFVDPKPREITVTIPPDRFVKQQR